MTIVRLIIPYILSHQIYSEFDVGHGSRIVDYIIIASVTRLLVQNHIVTTAGALLGPVVVS